VAILVLLAGSLLELWLLRDANRQSKVIETGQNSILAFLLLLVWLAFFSRLEWPTRVKALGAILLSIGLLVAAVDIRDVTGDLIPVFGWRWAKEKALPSATRTATDGPAPPATSPDDFPGFLGKDRNATFTKIRLQTDWKAHPPRERWRIPVGAGWSSFALVSGLALTQEQRGESETVVAYSLETGEEVWVHADPFRYDEPIGGVGPRATPTVVDGRVYALGATGRLSCLDLATGERTWFRDVLVDGYRLGLEWGSSCSPLVTSHAVLVTTGRRPDPERTDEPGPRGKPGDEATLIAYDIETGRPLSRSGRDSAGYASPMLARLLDTDMVLLFNQSSVTGHDLSSGEILWDHPWPSTQPNCSQPVVLPPDRILLSSGYSLGSKLLRLVRRADGSLVTEVVWESPRLRSKFANVVVCDGHIYGLDDGILVCLDLETGERRWKAGRYGHGQILLVGDTLLVLTEDGAVVLVEANPDEHRELARREVLSGKTWNCPALSGRALVVRNAEEAVCLELGVEELRDETSGR
jgi:outer membrane protein assembly factor BamB